MTPKLDWHTLRKQWNDAGQCAHDVCSVPLPNPPWFSRGSRLLFCESCAKLINKHTPGQCSTLSEQEKP